jgi:hypothetical protein
MKFPRSLLHQTPANRQTAWTQQRETNAKSTTVLKTTIEWFLSDGASEPVVRRVLGRGGTALCRLQRRLIRHSNEPKLVKRRTVSSSGNCISTSNQVKAVVAEAASWVDTLGDLTRTTTDHPNRLLPIHRHNQTLSSCGKGRASVLIWGVPADRA